MACYHKFTHCQFLHFADPTLFNPYALKHIQVFPYRMSDIASDDMPSHPDLTGVFLTRAQLIRFYETGDYDFESPLASSLPDDVFTESYILPHPNDPSGRPVDKLVAPPQLLGAFSSLYQPPPHPGILGLRTVAPVAADATPPTNDDQATTQGRYAPYTR